MSTPTSDGWLDGARRIVANIAAKQPCRIPNVTCTVCTTPVSAYQRCYRCNQHRTGDRSQDLADLVVPLAYAWEGQSQLGKDVYRYKRDHGQVAATAIGNLSALLYTFGIRHAHCPERALGTPVTAKTAMPSLRGNPGTTLTQMAERFLPDWPSVQVTATGNYGDNGRSLDPAHLHVDPSGPVTGGHVLVLEDTWVTGGHSQSIAVALKHAGAATVTVIPICLLLNPTWPPNTATANHRTDDPGTPTSAPSPDPPALTHTAAQRDGQPCEEHLTAPAHTMLACDFSPSTPCSKNRLCLVLHRTRHPRDPTSSGSPPSRPALQAAWWG